MSCHTRQVPGAVPSRRDGWEVHPGILDACLHPSSTTLSWQEPWGAAPVLLPSPRGSRRGCGWDEWWVLSSPSLRAAGGLGGGLRAVGEEKQAALQVYTHELPVPEPRPAASSH